MAIHEDELGEFLRRVGLEDAYCQGALTCSSCGDVIVTENLGAVKKGPDDTLIFGCDRIECLEEFHAYV